MENFLEQLKQASIHTWFDLGIFIDRFREDRKVPVAAFNGSFNKFKKNLQGGGIAFISYHYSVDGVTIETDKYAKSFRYLLPQVPIHYIAGEFYPEAKRLINPSYHQTEMKEMMGFEKWPLYTAFYFTKLKRGSKEYNELIIKFWNETLVIVEKLALYISKHNINLLYLLNTNSNPGNLSLSLALALLSDGLGIPVINNNHDFYWEGGHSYIDKKNKKITKGPRDFFYKNYDVGEFFSLIEMLIPWESRSWLSLNINQSQSEHLIKLNGHNPANVSVVNTAVDTKEYTSVTKRRNIESFKNIQRVLSGYQKKLNVYTPNEILNDELINVNDPKPLLIGRHNVKNFDFVGDNIVFLQPTRIMPRKRIETDFNLIKQLFDHADFYNKFLSNSKLKLTLLISGPIPIGQYKYLLKLIGIFSGWLETIDKRFVDRIFLGFLFSEFDKARFMKHTQDNMGMPELYNIASLILLPSETEGRGLPIIESCACGIPIFCRRYYPENVYSEVIGEHLEENQRLKVLEFDGFNITREMVSKITNRVFFPQNHLTETIHNQHVVQQRFSLQSLNSRLEQVLFSLYLQLLPNNDSFSMVVETINTYKKTLICNTPAFHHILDTTKRTYMPGFGKLGFMQYLKSLIDPSFFRVEEQRNKGMAMCFARKLVIEYPENHKLKKKALTKFYNAVDNIFHYKENEVSIRHDHTFTYRHRNKNLYKYHECTSQERSGLINMLFHKIIGSAEKKNFLKSPHFFTDWNLALFQMTNSTSLEIDDRARLIGYLRKNVPIAFFPGEFIQQELEYFILQPIRSKLGLNTEEELTVKHLKNKVHTISQVNIFCSEYSLGKWLTYNDIYNYLNNYADRELQLLNDAGIIKLIKTHQWTVGVHFAQLGEQALQVLGKIKDDHGFIIASGDNPAIMTDIVDIDRFHIGRADNEIAAHMLGISLNGGFIQFAPAGIRTTLTYPVPIQTAKDFHNELDSDLYKSLCSKLGEPQILNLIKKDAKENGSPIKKVLRNIHEKVSTIKPTKMVTYSHLSGVYKDGMPWSGVLAKTSMSNDLGESPTWTFGVCLSQKSPKRVLNFINDFESKTGHNVQISWNGGYILNAELVGKLGISENFIGSPLGLVISKNEIICPPLFNKPALIIGPSGKIQISRVNCASGITISDGQTSLEFTSNNYNLTSEAPCYYDLMYDKEYIIGKGRVIVRLAGNKIKEIIHPQKSNLIKILPVGLTLSVPVKQFPKKWNKQGKELKLTMHDWPEIQDAIEAGPLLVDKGKNCINMEIEGWKTQNSIETQAARIDYTDMRGPKIAAGIDSHGGLTVLAINGRIRESVGATHSDMADILIKNDVKKAMGFDPGGSSTLMVGHEQINISPYNPGFEEDIYSLPPVARGVSSAVIGWVE